VSPRHGGPEQRGREETDGIGTPPRATALQAAWPNGSRR
jgi:hypothetical protein